MTKVLYSRLLPSSNEITRRGRTNVIENDEEKVELLADDEFFVPPPMPSKAAIRMQQIRSFCNDCWNEPFQLPKFNFLNELGKSQLENHGTRIFFFLATSCMVITITYLRRADNLMQDHSQSSYHSSIPLKITTEVDSKMKHFLNTSLSDVKPLGFPLPVELQNLGEIGNPLQTADFPFFFHIPRSGGSTVKDIMSECIGVVIASASDIRGGLIQDNIPGMMYSPDFYAGATLFNQRQNGRCVKCT